MSRLLVSRRRITEHEVRVDRYLFANYNRFSISYFDIVSEEFMRHQELIVGLIRLHILHHAAEGEIFGQWMIDELARHGYRLSPGGTLYPLLHRLTERGYLRVREVSLGRTRRRLYRATPKGRRAMTAVREHVRELFGELEESSPKSPPRPSEIHDA